MIRNDQQLAKAQKKHAAVQASIAETVDADARADAERFARQLERQIDEYTKVRDGRTTLFELASIDDLPRALIKARIAKGWTQRHLAEALDITEQQVQKDEAGGYEKAGLARVADVLDVLGYTLHGRLRPADSSQPLTLSDSADRSAIHEAAARHAVALPPHVFIHSSGRRLDRKFLEGLIATMNLKDVHVVIGDADDAEVDA